MELFIFFMKAMQCSLNRPSPRVAMMVEMIDNERQRDGQSWPKTIFNKEKTLAFDPRNKNENVDESATNWF